MTGHPSLCLHGHFYQPPRENAWTEQIEIQESAAPFHDWNHKIHHECYLPNVRARVLDPQGRILDIVNNLEMISFNFGPTLISWIETEHPETYRAILWADKASSSRRGGHGNAIAQGYSHLIMPLANLRDKITQVEWGIRDFQYRFDRLPESLWLPETACNEETLEVLVDKGLRYLILEPRQAEAIRPLAEEGWSDVSNGGVDPSQPYRCFLKKDPAKFIDIFFYDGPISKAVSFEDLAFDAKKFMDRIQSAALGARAAEPLISVATDGETYGHHKPYGDRTLAYLTTVEAKNRDFPVTNFGEFLEKHPPQFAVRLKEGENGEGTSWSCPHGVKRWKDHCGCRGDGDPSWTQYWRKPLRESLDWLRDELIKIFETLGAEHFKDPWEARNDYINLILERTAQNETQFFERHAVKPPNETRRVTGLKLLEMQRQAMLMYTSCGWFFTELSGIETVQILQYAMRAIELAGETAGIRLEEEFLKRLENAKSNVPEFGDGRGVYEKLIRPSQVSLPALVAQYAICDTVSDYKSHAPARSVSLDIIHQRKENYGNLNLNYGRARIACRATGEENDLVFIALQFGTYDFRCSVKPFLDDAEFKKIEQELFDVFYATHIVELLRKIDSLFGEKYYALKDLLLGDRIKVISLLTKEIIGKIDDVYEQLFEENKTLNEVYRSIRLPIPEEIRYATIHTLKRKLKAEVHLLSRYGFDPRESFAVVRIIQAARDLSVQIKMDEIAGFLSEELARKTADLNHELNHQLAQESLNILALARQIEVDVSLRRAQDHLLSLIKRLRHSPEMLSSISENDINTLSELIKAVGINPQDNLDVLRQSLR